MEKKPIKIFVGCDPNNCDLEQMMVLDYSIKKHTSEPYEIVWMQLSKDPNNFWYSDPEKKAGWDTQKWVTPFSGFRWAIPAYCNYEGRAIYMDGDVIVLSDIADLWSHPINNDSIVIAKGKPLIKRLCVALWDCEKAKNILPSIEEIRKDPNAHSNLMNTIEANPHLVTPFNDSYNCLDGEDLPIEKIKILHYTDIDTQFSHKYSVPRLISEGSAHWFDSSINTHWRPDLIELFDQYYQEAIENGYSIDDYRIDNFGEITKASQKNYGTFRDNKKGFLSRLWKKIRGR